MTGRARATAIALAALWLGALVLLPFLVVAKISLAEVVQARPPFTPLLDWPGDALLPGLRVNWRNYALLFSDPLYVEAYLSSLRLAGIATAIALVIAVPMAHALTRVPDRWRSALLVLAILPFWTSSLIRVYAWIGILGPEGPVNRALQWVGVVDVPLAILNTDLGIVSGLVYSYLPFMLLPVYASLVRIDPALLEAAADLGCRPARAFFTITLPLAAPGILAGCLLVFIPAVGEFVVPDLMGGSDTLVIGKVLWTEFFTNRDWPLAGAATVVLVLLLVTPVVALERNLFLRGESKA
jgi:putrescine transport system permease protein